MTVSIVMPTCGRPSLRRALESVVRQLRSGDEVIVVGDGVQPDAERICRAFGPSVEYVDGVETRCFGNRQRQAGMAMAAGDYLLFLDDDDTYVPGALDAVREAAAQWLGRPMLFQFIDRNGAVLWRDAAVRQGNVSTQQVVFPNRSDRLGVWGDRYEGDFDFIRSTLDQWPNGDDAVVWRPNILADCRQMEMA
jgi:glycosyltransferase involved in cell wall biosynthesis